MQYFAKCHHELCTYVEHSAAVQHCVTKGSMQQISKEKSFFFGMHNFLHFCSNVTWQLSYHSSHAFPHFYGGSAQFLALSLPFFDKSVDKWALCFKGVIHTSNKKGSSSSKTKAHTPYYVGRSRSVAAPRPMLLEVALKCSDSVVLVALRLPTSDHKV